LERALTGRKADVSKLDGGLKVVGMTSDDIGKMAFEAGVPLYELAPQIASLEEAFLELTAGSEEFATKKETV
jgi:ABC-2 type transport system ATP-binding protein